MADPVRYVGDPFHYAGMWWREGRVGSHVVDGLDDGSPIFRGRTMNCPLCRLGHAHSTAAHRAARRADLKTAVCTPERRHLVTYFP